MSDRRAISAGKKPATFSEKQLREARERANNILNIDDEKLKRIAELEAKEEAIDRQLATMRGAREHDVTVLSRETKFVVEDTKGIGELEAFLTNVNVVDHCWRGRVHLKVKVARTYSSIRNKVEGIVNTYNMRVREVWVDDEEPAVTIEG